MGVEVSYDAWAFTGWLFSNISLVSLSCKNLLTFYAISGAFNCSQSLMQSFKDWLK
jgi:hypothetical protein